MTARTVQPWTSRQRVAGQQTAVAMYTAGHTVRCVADAIGCSWTTAHTLLAETGTRFRPPGHNSRCTADH